MRNIIYHLIPIFTGILFVFLTYYLSLTLGKPLEGLLEAEDADLGKASQVEYSLDPVMIHSKYFSISPSGEISTKQSVPQLVHVNRLHKFDLKVGLLIYSEITL